MKDNGTGVIFGVYGEKKVVLYENMKEDNNLEDTGVDVGILLNVKKWDWRT
jgi:hypothetical protein